MNWDGRHLLDVEGLGADEIGRILSLATEFRLAGRPGFAEGTLRGANVALLFAEPSTRTRLSFELAARRLGAETYVLEPLSSSMVKGETLVDTVRNLDALGFSVLVVRHHRSGAAAVAARYFGGSVVNAGDGWHAHPTQALLDLFTLTRELGDMHGRKIAIVGDVLHSRVARSNIWTLTKAGAEVLLCGPRAWLRGLDSLPVSLTTDLDEALRDADAVMGLRVQKERMAPGVSLGDYIRDYQITEPRLAQAAPSARYLHPGPINEGVEVTREVARGRRSLVLEQARNGVPVRMAVLAILAGSTPTASQTPAATYVGTRG
ncbi:MAG: aspartate carbamoyltransferase catalytic subunit [Chloroflexota bacterium]